MGDAMRLDAQVADYAVLFPLLSTPHSGGHFQLPHLQLRPSLASSTA